MQGTLAHRGQSRMLSVRPSPAAAPGSWSGPFLQEIPFHLQLSDLLVKPGHESFIGLLASLVVAAEDAGRSPKQGLLPGMDLARVDFKPAGQLCNGVLPLERG